MPPNIFWNILEGAWTANDSTVLPAAGGDLSIVRELFRYAKFNVQSLPEFIPIWRGGCLDYGPSHVCEGLSWTMCRNVACYFATMKSRRSEHMPCVVSSKVPVKLVLALPKRQEADTLNNENEVIVDAVSYTH